MKVCRSCCSASFHLMFTFKVHELCISYNFVHNKENKLNQSCVLNLYSCDKPSVHVWCITVCHQAFRREAIVYRLPCISKQRASVNSQQILQRCTYLIFVLRDVQIVEKIEFLLSVVVFYLLDLCQIFLFFLYQTGSLLVSLFQFLCQGLCNDKYF